MEKTSKEDPLKLMLLRKNKVAEEEEEVSEETEEEEEEWTFLKTIELPKKEPLLLSKDLKKTLWFQ